MKLSMKHLLFSMVTGLASASAFALDVSCKTPHGTQTELIHVVGGADGYQVLFDNIVMPGFSCIDPSSSDFFRGLVRCTTFDGALVEILSVEDSLSDGTYIADEGSAKVGLRCFAQ